MNKRMYYRYRPALAEGLRPSKNVENRINEEVVKKRAVKFYLSLHVNFHLSTDVAFLTDPPAVLSTDTIGVYDSCDVHDALSSTYENLVSAIEDIQQRGSG